MTSHAKSRFILISILIGLLIVLLLLILLFRDRGQEGEPILQDDPIEELPIDNTRESTVIAPPAVQDVPRTVAPGTADQGLVAKQAARIFVERFGTYSTQNQNAHIASVADYVTPSMWNWVETQAVEQTLAHYSGVITQVIASTLTEYDETTATVTIQARQILESETEVTSQARNGRVELVQSNNTWLVSGLYWED